MRSCPDTRINPKLLCVTRFCFSSSLASNVPSGFPRITKHPFLVKTSTGEDATFNCNATGTPEPSISWMKDKLPLNLSQSSKYTAPSRGVLRITNVQPEDKGSFECVVSSRMGMVYSRAAKLLLEGSCFFLIKEW